MEAVRKGKNPSLFVVLFEDSAAMLGLSVAFLGVLLSQVTGLYIFDGLASVVIGLILGGTAVWLAYETKGLLIGESANREIVDAISEMAASLDPVEKVNEVLTLHMGPEYILVTISVDFCNNLSAGEVENTIFSLDGRIKRAFPTVRRVFIEPEAISQFQQGREPAETPDT